MSNSKSNFPNAQQPAVKPGETGKLVGNIEQLRAMPNIINLRLDITHLYYPAKNSFQKGRLKRREIFTELLLYTLTT